MTQILLDHATGESVMAGLIAGLDIEFGADAGTQLAGRFWEAEACDFLWDSRLCERWLGGDEDRDDGDESGEEMLDRVAIMVRLQDRWSVAVLLVDGDGRPHVLLGQQYFTSQVLARQAYAATG